MAFGFAEQLYIRGVLTTQDNWTLYTTNRFERGGLRGGRGMKSAAQKNPAAFTPSTLLMYCVLVC